MTLVKYRNHLAPIELIKQLLSYAVGSASDEKLSNILEQVYSQGDSKLYVCIGKDGSALGIIGFKREGVSAEILHIAVDEHNRNGGVGRRMIDELLKLENLTELTAETDHDAVEFYRRYGFEIQPLGEKYPEVERFHCRLLLS
ncbi:GNAT family N-acetyltransferase [Alicyclobacillus curvatus]|nr:GNAT family N-acetyltransferase [Alicyclobacillus curvatus]